MDSAIARVLGRDQRIAYALVFGSVARDAAHAGSDLDVGVGLVAGASLFHHDIGDLTERLLAEGALRAPRVVDRALLAVKLAAVRHRNLADLEEFCAALARASG